MDSALHFAYPYVLYGLLPVLFFAVRFRGWSYKAPTYCYPLADLLSTHSGAVSTLPKKTVFLLRTVLLLGLILLIARPQLVDEHSKVTVDGIDIVLALDVSGSMQLFDDHADQTQRIAVAKTEALKFVHKRKNDPIGLVLFGKEAVSRCPLTLDRKVLETIIEGITLGDIDPGGTVISKGIITALNRLQKSESKTKIIILLTDGEPTPDDLNPADALILANKYGVKIYTIGIGGKYGGLYYDQFFGQMQQAGVSINTELLNLFAKETGGRFFLAKDQKELEAIYDTIDTLEKTEYQTDVYRNFHDIFMPFLWMLAAVFLSEIVLTTFVWFAL